jgi:ATP-dependent Lhr-like helicase
MSDPSDNTPLPDRWAQRAILSAFYGDFSELHSIQEQAFQPIYGGQDALILSPTGSGKTEAALAPLMARWFRSLRADRGPVIVYVSPTKALVNDLYARLSPPCAELGVSIGVRHGDRSDLNRSCPPALLITTPESLDVLIARGDHVLAGVRSVVIDEIHLLYNAQRGLQLSVLVGALSA